MDRIPSQLTNRWALAKPGRMPRTVGVSMIASIYPDDLVEEGNNLDGDFDGFEHAGMIDSDSFWLQFEGA